MFRAAVLLSLASVVLAALALISCLSVEDKREIRAMPRFAWVLVILLLPLLGPIGWFLFGRPAPLGKTANNWLTAAGLGEPTRPTAPDDDPDFLRSLEKRTRGRQDPPATPPADRDADQGKPTEPPTPDASGPREVAGTGDPDAVDGGTLSPEDEALLRQWEADLHQADPGGPDEPGATGQSGPSAAADGPESATPGRDTPPAPGDPSGPAHHDPPAEDSTPEQQEQRERERREEERRRRDSGSDS